MICLWQPQTKLNQWMKPTVSFVGGPLARTGNERAVNFYERAGFILEINSRKPFELGGTSVEETRYVRDVG